MQIAITDYQGSGFRQVSVSHDGKSLLWETTQVYGKVKVSNFSEVFREINGYFESLSPKNQDAIFQQFVVIKEALDDLMEPFYLEQVIKQAVLKLYDIITFESVKRFMVTNVALHIPPDTKTTLDPTDQTSNASKTYLVDEYRNLAALALAIRPMIPIWGEYIGQVGQGQGNDLYKEMDAVGLLSHAPLMGSEVIDKLMDYLTAQADAYPVIMSSLLKGLSRDETPTWLLSLVLVRRLPIVPLTASSQSRNIVSDVFSYVKSRLRPDQHQQEKQIKPKRPESEAWEDEDNKSSLYENYKIKEAIPSGDVVLNDVYSHSLIHIGTRVDPTLDEALLQKTQAYMDEMLTHPIEDHQRHLTQWVLGGVVSGRIIGHYANKRMIVRLMAVTQALLWHWNFIDLACVVNVRNAALIDENAPMITSGSRVNTRFREHQIQELNHYFPHQKQLKNNRPGSQYNNVAINDVAIMTRQILQQDWRYQGPPELKKASENNHNQTILAIPSTIKNDVVDLAIHLAKLRRQR